MSTVKKGKNRNVKLFLLALAVIFVCIFTITAIRTYSSKYENETFDQVDFYSMAQFSADNCEKVVSALKSGNMTKLTKLVGDEAGAEEVMSYADWRNANFDTAVSYGAGSYAMTPDKNGMTDVAERIVVQAGEEKYMLYIETLTSRWGRKNEGVSAIGAINYSRYKDLDGNWDGEKDDESVLAGTLLRDRSEDAEEKSGENGE